MNNLNVFGCGYLPFRLTNIPFNVKHFFKTIKWGWQRATKGYCEYDLWALDNYYSNLFSASIKQFAKVTHGHPYSLTEEEWDEVLNEISNCFYKCNEANDYFKDTLYEEYLEKCGRPVFIELENGMSTMKFEHEDEFKDLHAAAMEQAKENVKKREAAKEKGFYLLNRWFDDLWD